MFTGAVVRRVRADFGRGRIELRSDAFSATAILHPIAAFDAPRNQTRAQRAAIGSLQIYPIVETCNASFYRAS